MFSTAHVQTDASSMFSTALFIQNLIMEFVFSVSTISSFTIILVSESHLNASRRTSQENVLSVQMVSESTMDYVNSFP